MQNTMHPRSKAAVGLLVTGAPVMLAVGLLTNADFIRWPILITALVLAAIAAYIGRSLLPEKTEIADDAEHEMVADTPKDKVILWIVITAAMSMACWLALHFTK